jgi:DNA replication initiation complex subunit (GINS family)
MKNKTFEIEEIYKQCDFLLNFIKDNDENGLIIYSWLEPILLKTYRERNYAGLKAILNDYKEVVNEFSTSLKLRLLKSTEEKGMSLDLKVESPEKLLKTILKSKKIKDDFEYEVINEYYQLNSPKLLAKEQRQIGEMLNEYFNI